MTTSAAHLELVTEYTTEAFLATYKRFTSRRGIPAHLYSDCGTNFIGADRELKILFTQHTKENQVLENKILENTTRWHFNPPGAPHMGGKWEALIKSTKYHLKRTIGESKMTYEEASTLLTQIEAILNSRPLEPLSDDPDDLQTLTPGHFLTGTSLMAVPEPCLLDLSTSRLSRWQFIQQITQQFWSQWSSQYLQRQQSISKWHHVNNKIQVGSLILISDERAPPCRWPLGRVTKLLPGTDGEYTTDCPAIHQLIASQDGKHLKFNLKYWEWEHNHEETYDELQIKYNVASRKRKTSDQGNVPIPRKKPKSMCHASTQTDDVLTTTSTQTDDVFITPIIPGKKKDEEEKEGPVKHPEKEKERLFEKSPKSTYKRGMYIEGLF
ncbi:uncharacterized protein LOC122859841 [Aphidius gifuensis]|uniref:uncharacterized protein LOC122859841 n=1 Tax=Aphidius gifuensis TaxID=684658 RepID=UPI001CDB722F|nr:uncharacterized protein LOC122859841 [Aphidius gifuensis]